MLWRTALSLSRRPWLRRSLLAVVAVLLLGVVSVEPRDAQAQAPRRVVAPELQGVGWLGTDDPIYLRNLRGKIVILDFWTLC